MPLATCPNCRNSLDVPAAFLGGPVRCANCLSVFTPPAASPSIPVVRPVSTPSGAGPDTPAGPAPARPPRRWLWVLTGGCSLILLTCLGSCAGLFGVMSNPPMKPYTAEDGAYAAVFPGDPRPVVRRAGDGRDVGGMECRRDLPAEEHYFVEFVALTDDEKKKDDKVIADEAMARWVKDHDGVAHETDAVDHKGLPATRVIGQIGLLKGNVVAKAMRDGDRAYVVGVTGGVMPWNDRVVNFLDAFTPRGAPDKDRPPDGPPPKKGGKRNPFKGA
jgi:hypothetical protein